MDEMISRLVFGFLCIINIALTLKRPGCMKTKIAKVMLKGIPAACTTGISPAWLCILSHLKVTLLTPYDASGQPLHLAKGLEY